MPESSPFLIASRSGAAPRDDANVAFDGLWRILAGLIALLIVLGAFFAPAYPFTSDGAIHAELVRAFAGNGVFYIADNSGVEGAPPLLNVSTHAFNGVVYPQYPSGYGIVGAPFYAALGLRGLVILNALAAAGVLFLTYFIAEKLHNRLTAQIAVLILAFATYFSNYAFGIWPHMFALFMWFSAAALAVKGDQTESRPRQLALFAVAGLIVGLGVTVRVDMVLAIPAIFIWMRLFARPDDRIGAIAFIAAATPGLLAAAAFNDVKFGVSSPFYYGEKPGPDDLSHYMWLLPVTIIAASASLAINIPRSASYVAKRVSAKGLLIGAGAIGAVAIAFLILSGFYRHIIYYLYSIYVLAIDLQGYNSGYMQPGVEYNEYGHLLFWDFPKRALLQSVPFASLAILPMIDILRGRSLKAHSLAALIIFTPICFYAIKQWHGGGAYNMRYFLPALPFISILSATALIQIMRVTGAPDRRMVIAAIVAGAATFTMLDQISKSSEALFAPLALYPQLIIATLIYVALLYFAISPAPRKAFVNVIFFSAIGAISYAAMVNFSDEASHEKSRAEQLRHASVLAATLPEDALILSTLPVLLTKAKDNDVSIFYVTEDTAQTGVEAINAFETAGRCVYFHNSLVPKLLSSAMDLGRIEKTALWAGGSKFSGEPKLQLFVLAAQKDNCGAI